MAGSGLVMFALRWQCLRMLSAMREDQGMAWVAVVSHTEQASHEGCREGCGDLDLGNKPRSLGASEHKRLRREWESSQRRGTRA